MHIGVITNPNSRKNRNRPDRAERLQRIVGDLGEVHQTTSIASIKPVLREFLRKRARYWVADGGDGALHWMLRTGMEILQEDEFVGQSAAKANLKVFIDTARERAQALDHVLLFGPPGLGKTTLSHIIAHELGVNLRQTSCSAFLRRGEILVANGSVFMEGTSSCLDHAIAF